MKHINTGVSKSSIKSVAKSAVPDGKISGIKSNNGMENAVSAIEGKERSEAILEAMFEFGIQHAQEFAQRDLDEDLRWWGRMNQRTMVENFSASQKAAGAAGGAGAIAGGMAGLGAGLAGLFDKKNEGGSGDGIHGQNPETHGLVQKEIKDGDKGKQNPDGQPEQSFHNEQMIAQNETQTWDNQDFETMDATDPDAVFGDA